MDALGRLLADLGRRHRRARAGRAAIRAWWWCGGGALAALLILRLGGLVDRPGSPALLALPLLAALAWGLLRARLLPPAAAARLADRAAGTDDLLLTAVQRQEGPWGAAVRQRAEAVAGGLAAARILPARPGWRAGAAAALALLLAAAWWLVPLRDPFAWRERRLAAERATAALAARTAEARTAARALAAAQPAAPLSPAAAAQLDRLLAVLAAPPPARAELAAAQRGLEEVFRTADAARLDPRGLLAQRLGADDGARRLQEALARGDADPAAAAMAKARDLAQRLAAADPAQRLALAGELRQNLERLAGAAAGRPAEAGLRAALDHLARSADAAQAAAALQALDAQLALSQLALQELAQQGRDAAALADALRTLALARRLDGAGGRPVDAATSLAEYRRLYEDALARQAQAGHGTGPGLGDGSPATYRDDAVTAFDPERSPGALGAGRQLMSWAVQGPSDRGAVQEDHRAAAATVRQAVAEALERERLPPGQEAAVKRYFADPAP